MRSPLVQVGRSCRADEERSKPCLDVEGRARVVRRKARVAARTHNLPERSSLFPARRSGPWGTKEREGRRPLAMRSLVVFSRAGAVLREP